MDVQNIPTATSSSSGILTSADYSNFLSATNTIYDAQDGILTNYGSIPTVFSGWSIVVSGVLYAWNGTMYIAQSIPTVSSFSQISGTSGRYHGETVKVINDGYGKPAIFFWNTNFKGINEAGTEITLPTWDRETREHVLYSIRQQSGFSSLTEQNALTYYINWSPDFGSFYGVRAHDIHRNRLFKASHSFAFQVSSSASTYTLRFKTQDTSGVLQTRMTYTIRPSEFTGLVLATNGSTGWYPCWAEVELYFNREPKPSNPSIGYYIRLKVHSHVWNGQANPQLPFFNMQYVSEYSSGTHDATKDFLMGLTVQASTSAANNTFAMNYSTLKREW
jgi:hypothetical protein